MKDPDGTLGDSPKDQASSPDYTGANSPFATQQIPVNPDTAVTSVIPTSPFTKLGQGTFASFTSGLKNVSKIMVPTPVNMGAISYSGMVGGEISGKRLGKQEKAAQQEKIIALREEISSLEARTEDVFKIFLATNVPLVFDGAVQPAGEIKAQILSELKRLRVDLQTEAPNSEEVAAALVSLEEELADYWSIAERKLKETLTAKQDFVSDIDSIKSITDLRDRANALLEELANYHEDLTEEEKNLITLELEDIRNFVRNPSPVDEIGMKIKLQVVDKILKEKRDGSPAMPTPEDSDPAAAQALALEEASRREDLAQFQTKLGRFEEKISNLKKEKVFVDRNTLPRIEEVISKMEAFLRRYPEMGDVSVLKIVIEEQFQNLGELISEEEKILEQAKEKHAMISKRIRDLHDFISEVPELITKGDLLSVNTKIDSSIRGDIYGLVEKLRWLREQPHESHRGYDVAELRTQTDTLKELITKAEESLLSEKERERLEKEKAQEAKNAEQQEAISVLNELSDLVVAFNQTHNDLTMALPRITDDAIRGELIALGKELESLKKEAQTNKKQEDLDNFRTKLTTYKEKVAIEVGKVTKILADLEEAAAFGVWDGWPSSIRFETPKNNQKNQNQATPKKSGRWIIADANGNDVAINAKDAHLWNTMKINFDVAIKEYFDFLKGSHSLRRIQENRELVKAKNEIITALLAKNTDEAQKLIRAFPTKIAAAVAAWKDIGEKIEEEEKEDLGKKIKNKEVATGFKDRLKKQDAAIAALEETYKLAEPYLPKEKRESVYGAFSADEALAKIIEQLKEVKERTQKAIDNKAKDAGEQVENYEKLVAEAVKIFEETELRINQIHAGLGKVYNPETKKYEVRGGSSILRPKPGLFPKKERAYSFKNKKTGKWEYVDSEGWKAEQDRRVAEEKRISALTPEQMLEEGIERRTEKTGEQAYAEFLRRDPKGFKQAFVGKQWSSGDPLKAVVAGVISKYTEELRAKQLQMNDLLNKHRAEAERLGEDAGGYNTLAAAGYEKKLELLGSEIDSLDEDMIPQAEIDKRRLKELRDKAAARQSLDTMRQTYAPPEDQTKIAETPKGLTQEELRAYKAPEIPGGANNGNNMVNSYDMNDAKKTWQNYAKEHKGNLNLQNIEKQGYRNAELEEMKNRKFAAVKNLFASIKKFAKVDPNLPNAGRIQNRWAILGGGAAIVAVGAVSLGTLLPDDNKSREDTVARTAGEKVPLESWRKFVTGDTASSELNAVVKDFVDDRIGFDNFAKKYFTEMGISGTNPDSLRTVAQLEPFVLMSDAATCAGTNNDQRKQLCDYIVMLQAIGDATRALVRGEQRTMVGFVPHVESMSPKPGETFEQYYMRILTAAVNADTMHQALLQQSKTKRI